MITRLQIQNVDRTNSSTSYFYLIQAIERSWSGPWGHSLLASVLLGLLHVTACMGKGPEQLNPNSRLNGTQV
ncbi:hypothetical protein VDIAB_100064 [Vibrio diabolicus]|nr:hypothetical protein VDIAB_100064 [Vibrio diabolicus]